MTLVPGLPWHTQPAGQTLIVTAGQGWTQVWGELHKGDVVNCLPSIKHWHGMRHDSTMSHIEITGYRDSENIKRLEKVRGTISKTTDVIRI